MSEPPSRKPNLEPRAGLSLTAEGYRRIKCKRLQIETGIVR